MAMGRMQLEVDRINARQFVEETVKVFHVNARQCGINFLIDLGSVSEVAQWENVEVNIDANKMAQVLRNLVRLPRHATPFDSVLRCVHTHLFPLPQCSNALKFTPPNGKVIVALRRVEYPAVGGGGARDGAETESSAPHVPWLRLDVVDSGAGISAANMPRLFGRFVQFDASKLQKGGGTGLGLWISKVRPSFL
jgi:signal transduction histidine kinase